MEIATDTNCDIYRDIVGTIDGYKYTAYISDDRTACADSIFDFITIENEIEIIIRNRTAFSIRLDINNNNNISTALSSLL